MTALPLSFSIFNAPSSWQFLLLVALGPGNSLEIPLRLQSPCWLAGAQLPEVVYILKMHLKIYADEKFPLFFFKV